MEKPDRGLRIRLRCSAEIYCLVLAVGCTPSEEETVGPDFELGVSECEINSSLNAELGDGSVVAYQSCRVRYAAQASVLTWQLLAPGSSGDWLFPGPGWLNLSVAGDSPENATLTIASQISEVPARVALDEAVLAVTGLSGERIGARGTVQVGQNLAYTDGSQAHIEADFSNVSLTDGGSLSGTVSMAAAENVGTNVQNSAPGTEGGECDQSRCASYQNQCASTISQAPCYCAAACLCACAGDACEAGNRASAAQLGTQCSY